MNHTYPTQGTCSSLIDFAIEDGKLHDVRFVGGCAGNLKAIGKLVEGADARETADLLRGNTCGRRPTSCADQLARAIDSALA
ncbi:MAG TPA: TIGR03905 family protein [Eggerthellaceae bacterium]|nr:TIGR03905 family protein [Eggerthellaceae bacterium]